MMETLDKFQRHITLYCKGHYNVNKVDFITGLQRIWAVRCDMNVEHINDSVKEYIADDMYRIIEKTMPKKIPYIVERMHKELAKKPFFKNEEELTAIEKLIMFYRSEIMMLQVKEEGKVLVKLPKSQKRLFKRIIRGNARNGDYSLVKLN